MAITSSTIKAFVRGLWEDIPPFRLVLGLCPSLAVTQSVENGLGMGLATAFVLVFSNLLISILRNVIPKEVRIASYIVIIATFVTVVDMLIQAYAYSLYLKLGIFIPLIVVNCIVLGRAEAFASKNPPLPSMADGLGIGLGYTLSLSVLGAIRELLGTGYITFWKVPIHIFGDGYKPFQFMLEAPGAFICLGLMLYGMNIIQKMGENK